MQIKYVCITELLSTKCQKSKTKRRPIPNLEETTKRYFISLQDFARPKKSIRRTIIFSKDIVQSVNSSSNHLSTMAASGNPKLYYFDVCGRGEFSKLIAAVGGVELDCSNEFPFQVGKFYHY